MKPEILDALRYCPSLPTLPGVAVRVLELGRDPDVNLGVLAALLAKDPALASRVLRVCNSPFYAQRRQTGNLHQAVMLLGLNATMTVALSFSLTDLYRSATASRRGLDRIWKRAIISALCARLIGERVGMPALDELYLAGLLQDLGVLALCAAMGERYLPILARCADHDDLVMMERESLGCDHGEVGTWLMRHWGLPDRLAVSAAGAHRPEGEGDHADQRRYLRAVAVAGRLADVVLADGDGDAMGAAAASAGQLLGLGAEDVSSLFEALVGALPELGALFEVELISPAATQGLLDQARELLTVRNLRLIQDAADYHQQVVEIEQANKVLEQAAIHDALTGLHNRRHFDQVLDLEFALAVENRWPLTLGFIDLDYFKRVNDTQGHVVGDAVLVKVAEVLQRNLRARDYIMRYGGEEFVVLLPGHGTRAALSLFERIRAAVEDTVHVGESGARFRITASIGLASHMDEERRFEEPLDLVRAADRSLYDAKRGGRNRIVSAA